MKEEIRILNFDEKYFHISEGRRRYHQKYLFQIVHEMDELPMGVKSTPSCDRSEHVINMLNHVSDIPSLINMF